MNVVLAVMIVGVALLGIAIIVVNSALKLRAVAVLANASVRAGNPWGFWPAVYRTCVSVHQMYSTALALGAALLAFVMWVVPVWAIKRVAGGTAGPRSVP